MYLAAVSHLIRRNGRHKKQAQRKEAYEMIDNTCAEMLADGDAFGQYLEVQGRFDRYSVNNAILVSARCLKRLL